MWLCGTSCQLPESRQSFETGSGAAGSHVKARDCANNAALLSLMHRSVVCQCGHNVHVDDQGQYSRVGPSAMRNLSQTRQCSKIWNAAS